MKSDATADLTRRVAARLGDAGPHVIGVSGPVAVGKSTIARRLADALADHGHTPYVLGTDAFLHPNAILDERGLSYRKGFPESFDADALVAVLQAIASGNGRVEVPVYSHAVYDVVSGEVDVIEGADVVVVEGVNALQDPVRGLLNVGIYVHAAEEDVRRWYVERFEAHVHAARDDPSSFYRGFASMGAGEITAIAEATWDGINAPNLREHILPTREHADIVVHKDATHEIVWIEER